MAKRIFNVDLELFSGTKIIFPDGSTQNTRPNYTTFAILNTNSTIITDVTLITGGTTYTLPLIGSGKIKRIINASNSTINIVSSGGAGIGNKISGNQTNFKLYKEEVIDVFDDGTLWRIV